MNISPFGTNQAESTLKKNGNEVTTQYFLGCKVVDFSCNSDWGPEGSSCTINLIEDDGRLDRDAVVGSPQFFEIATTGDDLVFAYYGILDSLRRTVDANGNRRYAATLTGPSVLLQACSVITQDYAGAGDALEAVAPNTATSLEFGHLNSSITWSNIYNVLNAYGIYENDDYGQSTPAGFGASQINSDGMRLDRFVSAIDHLINNNGGGTPQLGRPIIYGADNWNSPVSPYYYTFDINGFISQISSYIPNNYRVQTTDLLQFVSDLCDETNHVFMVDLLKPSGMGNANIVGPQNEYATEPITSETGTFGGEIKIITQNRNVYGAKKFPLAAGIIPYEISDKIATSGYTGEDLPLDLAWSGADIHPGGPPVASSPFGGSFPVEEIAIDEIERFISTDLSVSLNKNAVAGKMVVGGYQSRVGFIPYSTSNVYQYWGEIKRLDNYGSNSDESDTSKRGIPVVTKVLNPFDIVDCVLIDCQDMFGSNNMTGVITTGIYACSMLEIRYAMTGYDAWLQFMSYIKPGKLHYINSYFAEVGKNIRDFFYNQSGVKTYAGNAYENDALSSILSYNTASSRTTDSNIDCSDPINSLAKLNHKKFLEKLHEKIKTIGDDHYGKSWVVKQPAFTVKLDENEESVIANFVQSWDLSQDGYLEPTNFAAYEAPQSPHFVNNGRLSAYVNFDSNFSNSDIYGGYTVNYDFREYSGQRFAQTDISGTYIFSFLLDLDTKYLFLPSNYFTNYDRSNFSEVTTSGVMTPSLAVAINSSEVSSAVSYIFSVNSVISENGIGMLPYALCKTNRVYLPSYKMASAGKNVNSIYNLLAIAGFDCANNQNNEKNISGSANFFYDPAPVAVSPRSFGIPQQSNRFVYGPWITNNITLDYAAKVEYTVIESLVPENYIIPTTITIGGTPYTISSGLSGMNQVGQAEANTIDNFEYLFTENGTVTKPGLPEVTSLGQSLVVNGPLVSDISVNISVTNVTTTYSMKTFVPKLGRTNKYVIKEIKKLGDRVKSLGNLVR